MKKIAKKIARNQLGNSEIQPKKSVIQLAQIKNFTSDLKFESAKISGLKNA